LEAARSAGDERVRTLRAAAEALPLRDRALRFVWCRDMLNHVDLPGAMRECARILVPGGAMLVYQTFAADSLEPREADRIYRTFSIVPRNMDPLYFERCAGGAGFAVAERDVIGGEWREWWEDDGARRTSQSLLRASRLLRASDDLRREFGDAAYEFAFADQLWGIYQMIGKLQPTAYVLRRE
jgi:SAM-dependent methyltransferase